MRNLLEAADFVVSRLADAGFSRPHRFSKMRQALSSSADVIGRKDARFPLAREAIRDIRLMEFSLETLGGSIDEHALKSKLKAVIDDPVDPTDTPRGGTAGRNVQSELFVAAICKAAMLAPRFLEPDIIIRVSNDEHAIAVKRPRSEEALDRRIQEGIGQIRRCGYPGIVAVDGTLLCNPDNLELRGNIPVTVVNEAACRYVCDLARTRLSRWKASVPGIELVAIVFQFHVLQNSLGTQWRLNTLTFPLNPNEGNSSRTRAFKRFDAAFRKGIPGTESDLTATGPA